MSTMRYTPEQVVDTLKETKGLQALAATKLGCSVMTIWRYAQKFPKVADEIKHQREGMLDVAEGKLYQAINNGEAWAICFFLKTQGKARHYSERHEITGAEGKSLTFTLKFDSNDVRMDVPQYASSLN